MSEEELKAIKHLKNYKYDNEVRQSIDIILNLIEKQQGEIEKLRIKNGKEFARGMETNEKLWQAKIEDKIETIKNETWFIDGCDAQLACIDELMSL